MPPPARSPCVKLCVLDARGVCEGCGRTMEEISAWPSATEAARLAILRAADGRRAARRMETE
jgi:predicted Fe-S protein YdhL (DUF1289 family)